MLTQGRPLHAARRRRQHGMSLVELMVGIAIGLIIVAAATVMAATQLTENRRLLLETQIQQDMRATMDIMTRELRRAGHFSDVPGTVWSPLEPERSPSQNTFAGPVLPSNPGSVIQFQYFRPITIALNTSFSYFLQGNIIFSQAGANTPEPLTDYNALRVTSLTFERLPAGPAGAPLVEHLTCPNLCADGTENCWPSYTTYDIKITMTAVSALDSTITRTMEARVRARNDATRSSAPAGPLCP